MATVYWIRAPHHTDMFAEGYVGFSSRGTEKRFKQHKKDSKRDKYKHLPIYRAFAKYGDSLTVSTIVEGPDDYCLMIEQKLRPTEKIGWNINRGGEKASLGTKRSKESCEKQSKTMTGMKRPKEFGEAIRLRTKGVKKSPEQIAKMSAYNKTLMPWENGRADKGMWVRSEEFFEYFAANPKHGALKLAKNFGLVINKVTSILKEFRNGWIPQEDEKWLAFKATYNEQEVAFGT